jgi:CheY-like chemotaxis protein
MTDTTTFLLVEDDPNDVFFVEREFERTSRHLRLLHVGDGESAVRYLEGDGECAERETHPLPNVILLDLNMPGLNGFDFLEWLHSESPGDLRLIPVVVLSSSSLQEDIKRAYALGANSYVTKPGDWGTFQERIRILGTFWSEHVETPEIPPPHFHD